MDKSGLSSGSSGARSVQRPVDEDPAWMTSPWTAVAFTSLITVAGMMVGKSTTTVLGWSPIMSFATALAIIVLSMWGLAFGVKRLRQARKAGGSGTPLDLAA